MLTACPQHVHNMFTTGPQNVLNVNLLRPSPGALRSNAVVKQPADRWWAPHAPMSKKRYARIIHMAAEEKPGFPLNRGDGIGDPFAIKRQTAGALPAHCESRDSVQDRQESHCHELRRTFQCASPRTSARAHRVSTARSKDTTATPSHGSGEDHCG